MLVKRKKLLDLGRILAVILVAIGVAIVMPRAHATSAISIDAKVSTHQSSNSNTIASPSFSTAQAKEVVLAFVGSDGPSGSGSQSFSSVTGGGLTWTLRQRSNTQAGTAEVWQAVTSAVLSNVTITATRAQGGYHGSIEVVSFAGADTTTNGAVAGASAATGAPSVSLTTTRNNSWVWATANDWDSSKARTVGSGQTLADQFLDATTGDTFWTQYQTTATPVSGTKVTLNDTAPTSDRWNFAAIEILPASTDTTPPTAPTSVSATAVSATQASLSWSASTDNVGVTGYNIYRSTTSGFTPSPSNLIGTSTTTTYNDTTTPGTYYYLVVAKDAAGNLSLPSNQASVTLVDSIPPTAPTNLSATAPSSTQASLSWSASTDNIGVVGYRVYRNGAFLATTTGVTYSDSGLTANTTYSYYVTAFDAAGNVSAQSATVNLTTPTNNPPANQTPPIISGTAAQGQTLSTSNGTWTNSPTSYVYQWQDCNSAGGSCVSISGATSQTYTLHTSDVGDTIVVQVTATNAAGSSTPASSSATAVVSATAAAAFDHNLGTVHGNAVNSLALTTATTASVSTRVVVTVSYWAGSSRTTGVTVGGTPATLDLRSINTNGQDIYEIWSLPETSGLASGSSISASFSSGTGGALLGAMSVSGVDMTNGGGVAATGSSTNQTGISWVSGTASTPGAIAVGGAGNETLSSTTATVSTGTKVHDVWDSPSQQGFADAYNIGGTSLSGTFSTSSTATTGGVVTYKAASGSGSAPVNTVLPVISGVTQQGSTLTTTNGSWNNSPTGYSYQWQGCASICTNISGATSSSYVLASTEVGETIKVVVTANNSSGSTAATSVSTGTITSNGNVIFSDTFGGTSLSPAWTVISRHGEYAQSETECNVPQAVSVNNMLNISTTAQNTTCGDFNLDGSVRHAPQVWPYATGDIQWSNFNFTYGTVSYTAKFPAKNTGTWPAVWLLGANCQATNIVTADVGYSTCPSLNSPGYVETDMTECDLNNWCQLASAQPSSFPTCGYNTVDTNWHSYSLVWNSSGIYESMDGQQVCSFTAAQGYSIPSTPMFLIIQTQTGGAGGSPNNANLPANFSVSNVTVTQP